VSGEQRKSLVARIAEAKGGAVLPKGVGEDAAEAQFAITLLPDNSPHGIIRATEAPPPPAEVERTRRGPRGPPDALPIYCRFRDLKQAGIVSSYPALRLLIEEQGFPPGVWFGANSRCWAVSDIVQWLANRPTDRPSDAPRRGGRGRPKKKGAGGPQGRRAPKRRRRGLVR
jgi:hypothetical protein